MISTILIVDDSATTRAMIRHVLQMTGLPIEQIYEAANGQAGLEILRAHQVALVLADLSMPVMDGAEMIRRMSTDPRTREIPVFVISAMPDLALVEELKRLGVRGYLPKPFTAESIRDMLVSFDAALEEGDSRPGPHDARAALTETLTEALETMAFICPELVVVLNAVEPDANLQRVSIAFSSEQGRGLLELTAAEHFGSAIVNDLANDNPANASAAGKSPSANDALMELANVTCGLLLRRFSWMAQGSHVALELPLIESACGDAAAQWVDDCQDPAAVALAADGEWIVARLTLAAAA